MISRRFAGLLAPLVVLFGCEYMVVPPEQDPLYLKTTDLDNRLEQVESQLNNEGLVSLLSKLDALEADVRTLRNDIETLQHEVEQANGRQRDLYLDIDARLQAIEQATARSGAAAGAAVVAGAVVAGRSPASGGTDIANYEAAFQLLKDGEYDQAALALQQFIVAFPDSDLIDNAQYWLAETRYVSQSYEVALSEFEVLLQRYPDSGKRPDALLKIGYCNYELEKWGASRAALSEVAKKHPETTAARLANQRLDRMKSEGH
jgi:tol-pal system protein YbgF